MAKRLTKRQAKRAGVSFYGKVNTHMLDNPVLCTVVKDGKTYQYYAGGLVAVLGWA